MRRRVHLSPFLFSRFANPSSSITYEQILNRLVLLYFASDTVDNHELRQCLSYFFPVYCYSNAANQRRVSNVRPFLLSSC
jgi:hypothetical protein